MLTAVNEAHAEDSMEHLPVPALQVDLQGRVVVANAAAAHWLTRPRAELLGARVAQVLPCAPPESFGRLPMARCGCVKRVPCWTASVSRCLGNDDVSVVFGQDLAELVALRERLVQADRLITMGALAAGIAHEVNNPLSYILSNLQFCLESPGQTEDVKSALQDAQVGAERIRVLARDLQAFSKPSSEARAPVELKRVAEIAATTAHSELRRKARVSLELGKTSPVRANEARLAQVVLHLMQRAGHGIEPGKPDQNQIWVRTADLGANVSIEVEDTGAPLPASSLPTLFDPGTAPLAMLVVHGLVAELGGRIEVTSTPGHGNRFRVLLPADKRPAPATPRLRVLVVDDDASVGRCFVRMLQPKHEAKLVGSGPEALAWLKDHPTDVVLCDLMMPQMSGLEFLGALEETKLFPHEQVILMSGGMIAESVTPALATRSNPKLEKPCDLRQLDAVLARVTPPRP